MFIIKLTDEEFSKKAKECHQGLKVRACRNSLELEKIDFYYISIVCNAEHYVLSERYGSDLRVIEFLESWAASDYLDDLNDLFNFRGCL